VKKSKLKWWWQRGCEGFAQDRHVTVFFFSGVCLGKRGTGQKAKVSERIFSFSKAASAFGSMWFSPWRRPEPSRQGCRAKLKAVAGQDLDASTCRPNRGPCRPSQARLGTGSWAIGLLCLLSAMLHPRFFVGVFSVASAEVKT
jgi:hypothetical protein